jgi:GNAT superfamily N-acetyltransferase
VGHHVHPPAVLGQMPRVAEVTVSALTAETGVDPTAPERTGEPSSRTRSTRHRDEVTPCRDLERSRMDASLYIRAVTPHEAEVLLEIQKVSSVAGFGHVFPPNKYPFPNEAVLDRWLKAVNDPAEVVVLAKLDDAAVGFAAMRSEWLDALYVIPSCWGKGVGPRLHDHALTWIRELGCKRCHLWVLEQNTRARHFYENRGWRLNGDARVVPFPPYPVDVGYTIDL